MLHRDTTTYVVVQRQGLSRGDRPGECVQVPIFYLHQSMPSLTEEIESFSRSRLRRQCTRVTSLSGRRIIETWKGSTVTVVEDHSPADSNMGYVPDTSWDLQIGHIKPFLLLGEIRCLLLLSSLTLNNTNSYTLHHTIPVLYSQDSR